MSKLFRSVPIANFLEMSPFWVVVFSLEYALKRSPVVRAKRKCVFQRAHSAKACDFHMASTQIDKRGRAGSAQKEYACRAGSTTQYHFGDSTAELGAFAWFEDNSGRQTAPVRLKKPNAWGLYDIIGNVWEWCLDSWHEAYTGAPCEGSPWFNTSHPTLTCYRGFRVYI
jgi:formylglycine-generating enzyme required for sulfatase activity